MIDYRNTIAVIGFDLDQTLYPKSPEIDRAIQSYLYKKIAEHRKVSLAEAEKLFRERYQDGKGMGGSSVLRDLGIPDASELVQEALEQADIASYLHPDRSVLELLNALKKQYAHTDLITGSNLRIACKKLDALQMPLELFEHAITGDDGSKSDGTLYRIWLSLYPTSTPEQFLYIGDRPRSDHEVPNSMGIQTILVHALTSDDRVSCPQLNSLQDLRELLI